MPVTQKKDKSQNPPSLNYKLEYLRWFLTIFCSVIVYICVAELIVHYYHPDVQRAIEEAKKISVNTSDLAPEPLEKLLFIVAILTFTTSISIFYFLFNKCTRKIKEQVLNTFFVPSLIFSAVLVLFITYEGLIASNPFAGSSLSLHDNISRTNFDFYFIGTFIYDHTFIGLCVLLPLILINFFYKYKFSENTFKYINITKKAFVYCFCATLILVAFSISVFKFPYTRFNKWNFAAVYYAVVQVYHGFPMLVNNFTSTYGLYPHFIIPFLKITGLSVLNFSFIMGLLTALCFTLILIFMTKIIKSKLLVLFGFTTLFFNCFMYSRIAMDFDPYFSLCPIRWLFPVLLIFYSVYYVENQSKRKYISSFFLFSLGVLWSPDFGILTYLSLFIFYSFLELNGNSIKIIVKKIAMHLFYAVSICCTVGLLYAIIIRIIYGSFPELLNLFSTIKVFSFIGFNMLPMPSGFHPWMIIALIYLIGLLYSVYGVVSKKYTKNTSIVFLLTVIGIASFSYYQGRSHNWTLFTSNFEAILLLTIFADDMLRISHKQKVFILPFSVLILFLFFSFFQLLYDNKRITDLISERQNKKDYKEEQSNIVQNADFIHGLTAANERVLILSTRYNQELYHDLSKTCSVINPGLMDLFFKSDYDRMQNFIINNKDTKIFFEPDLFNYYDNKIPALLSGLYNIKRIDDNSTMMLLEKKQEIINNDFILQRGYHEILHERFDNDFSNKLHYIRGEKGAISLSNRFTVEIVFKPAAEVKYSELTKAAAVLCNDSNEKGLGVLQADSAGKIFYFVTSNEAVSFPVLPGKWNYIAIEMNEKEVKIFSNGLLIKVVTLKNSYINSNRPLYIGSHQQSNGFFFGEIKEVRITNALLDEKDIKTSSDKVISL